jgi:hypothetical protein
LEVKRRWALVLVAVNLIGLVALVFRYPHLMVSPGALVPAHAELATDCFACHAVLRGAVSERCVACHTVADIGLRTTKGVLLARATVKTAFHQELITQDCISCHNGHQGSAFALGSHQTFSHGLLRATARDRCETCHAAPATPLHRNVSGACGQCHNQEGWRPATFDHDKLFLLRGDHDTTCATCHLANDYSRYTCYGCHEHQPDRMRAKHLREGISNFENCIQCHRNGSGEHGERGAGERREHDD